MNAVPLVLYKFLKFIHDSLVCVIHDTIYRPLVAHDSYSLDPFWLAPIGPLPPRKDLLY